MATRKDLEILAREGGPDARKVARQALAGDVRRAVEDAAAKALAALVGYPHDVRRRALELALRMLKTR